eukprot:gene3750-698_t
MMKTVLDAREQPGSWRCQSQSLFLPDCVGKEVTLLAPFVASTAR